MKTVLTYKRCLAVFVLLAGISVNACAKKQVVVPRIAPESTELRLVGKFVWFDLFTSDMAAAGRFYEGLFGWSFHDTETGKEKVQTIMRNDLPIANAVRLDPGKGDGNASRWLCYMSVEDVDKAALRVEDNRGSIYMPPKDIPDRGRVSVVKDPQGAVFAIVTATGGDPPDYGFDENSWMGGELWTRDLEKATSFYQRLAGYELRLVDLGGDSKYHLLVTDDKPRGGFVKIPWDDVKPDWVPYVAVRDAVAVAGKAVELGGRLLVAPNEDIREGSVAIIEDPSGAVFAVQQY